MISIYWLGLEGDDVRFDEPHCTTDNPILSFELNDGWELARGWWIEHKWNDKGLHQNRFYLVEKDKEFPWYYSASTVLMWILHWQSNGGEKPPFVKDSYLIDKNGKIMDLPITLKDSVE